MPASSTIHFFGEKAVTGGRHNRADLLLLCGLKGAL